MRAAADLVWVQGHRAPIVERWPDDAPTGVKLGKVVLARRGLTPGESGLSLTELARRHHLPNGRTA